MRGLATVLSAAAMLAAPWFALHAAPAPAAPAPAPAGDPAPLGLETYPDAPAPVVSPADRTAVLQVCRGYLDAVWNGKNPDDVAAGALKGHTHLVGVTLRNKGLRIGRGQAARADLRAGLLEAVILAVAEARAAAGAAAEAKAAALASVAEGKAVGVEAKAAARAAGVKAQAAAKAAALAAFPTVASADLRIDLELGGEPQAIRFSHFREGRPPPLQFTRDAMARAAVAPRNPAPVDPKADPKAAAEDAARAEAVVIPAEVLVKLQPLLGKAFARSDDLNAELARILTPAELERHGPRVVGLSRAVAPQRVTDDLLRQCRRGVYGLLLEYHTPTRVYGGTVFPAETITDNIAPVGFLSRALLRTKLPAHLSNRELGWLVDDGVVRAWRFRSVQFVEGDVPGSFREPVRGHRPVAEIDLGREPLQAAVLQLTANLVYRQLRQPHIVYFPAIDQSDPTPESPMDRALVAWALGEAARRFPDKPRIADAASVMLGNLRNQMRDQPVSVQPDEGILFLPADGLPVDLKPKSAPKTKPLVGPVPSEDLYRLWMLREPGGEAAHLGGVSATALAMTRMSPGAARDLLAGPEPEVVKLDEGEYRRHRSRERLMISVCWMQDRDPRKPETLGGFRTWFPPGRQIPGQDLYGGPALLTLSFYFAESGRAPVLARLQEAVRFYRKRFSLDPDWNVAAWHIPAFALLAEKTRDPDLTAFVLTMADRLVLKQVSAEAAGVEVDMTGAFPADGRSMFRTAGTSGLAAYALGAAHRTAVRAGDVVRARKYLEALRSSARFLLQLQYRREDLYYVVRPDLANGGIRFDPGDNGVSLVSGAMALLGLMEASDELWPKAR